MLGTARQLGRHETATITTAVDTALRAVNAEEGNTIWFTQETRSIIGAKCLSVIASVASGQIEASTWRSQLEYEVNGEFEAYIPQGIRTKAKAKIIETLSSLPSLSGILG